MHGNFFTKLAKYQFSTPRSYKAAAYKDNEENFRHKDHFQRVFYGASGERFLDPEDGRVKELVVQCTDDVYRALKDAKYKRTSIRNVSPITLRITNWAMNSFDDPRARGHFRTVDYLQVALKWPVSCLLLVYVVNTGEIVNDGRYDPFPFRYWGYCKIVRNSVERNPAIKIPGQPLSAESTTPFPTMARLLEPRALLFDVDLPLAKLLEPHEWKDRSSLQKKYQEGLESVGADRHCPKYVVVAYINTQFSQKSKKDMAALNEIGLMAAREAGVDAYWTSASCMPKTDLTNDVYRISDVVRGADSVVIAVGSREGQDLPQDEDERLQTLLQEWGGRVWTFPEVLLSQNQDIAVYERGNCPEDDEGKMRSTKIIPKNHFARYAWGDSHESRQLIDHFTGSLSLSRLQLTSAALNCLFSREIADWFDGDRSYALMGLLLKRPSVDETDTEFQAFARLSLANDSDKLLERLMCVLPQTPTQPWHCTSDKYGVNLWDIEPTCQIAGICDNDAILVDGAFGATIHWDKFRKVNARRRMSFKRIATQILFHGAPFFFALGWIICGWTFKLIHILDTVYPDLPQKLKDKAWSIRAWMYFAAAVGYLLILVPFLTFICSPYLTRLLYGGKFCESISPVNTTWLFGFEGFADLETIESHIFGGKLGRLRWSAYGSSLSYHDKPEASDDCEPGDPRLNPETKKKVERAIHNKNPDAMRIFTLVDTNTMTVTLFEAVKPPTVLLLCAGEGGMQRAIACSYEWTTGTCYRETVLRMETPVLEKMSRVPRVKLGLRNTPKKKPSKGN
ncbi:hypothetical protein N7495_005138 [Penicillium taxi]|uniref:uncharacterized protein n=1 Tax=Penicillium taxi TaxID=168475 RepID=UPI0025457AB5|nr:uncharacterized protein N7495_005138 [Penicillium taxi]KAJ5893447.1 hypothetical protein N7495_005138 [Penicillium taxi]